MNINAQANALEETDSQIHADELETTHCGNPASQEPNNEYGRRAESLENIFDSDVIQDDADDAARNADNSVGVDVEDEEEVEGGESSNGSIDNSRISPQRKRIPQAQKIDMLRDLAKQEVGEEQICKTMGLDQEQFRELFFLLCQKDKKYYAIKPWTKDVKIWMLGNGIKLSQEKVESLDANGNFKYGHIVVFKEVPEGILVTCRTRDADEEVKWQERMAKKKTAERSKKTTSESSTGNQNTGDGTSTSSAPESDRASVPPVQAGASTPASESGTTTN